MDRTRSRLILCLSGLAFFGVIFAQEVRAEEFTPTEIHDQIRLLDMGLSGSHEQATKIAAVFRNLSIERRDLLSRGIAPQAMQHLRTALKSKNITTVLHATMILGQIGFLDQSTMDELHELMKHHPDMQVRLLAQSAHMEAKRRMVLDVTINSSKADSPYILNTQKRMRENLRNPNPIISHASARGLGLYARTRREEDAGAAIGIVPEIYLELEQDLTSLDTHRRMGAARAFESIGFVSSHTRQLLESRRSTEPDLEVREQINRTIETIREKSGEIPPRKHLPASELPLWARKELLATPINKELQAVLAACHPVPAY